MKKMLRIVIIDDHPSVALGLRQIIEGEFPCEIVGSASTCKDGFKLVHSQLPAIVFLDLNLSDGSGVELCRQIKDRVSKVHVIIYTGYDYEPYVNQLIESGASGILKKDASTLEIRSMMEAVLQDKTLIPLHLFRQMQLHRCDPARRYWEADLTPLEEKLIQLVIDRATNAEIAQEIHVSTSSVEKYLKRMYDKLGVRTKKEAIARIQSDERF